MQPAPTESQRLLMQRLDRLLAEKYGPAARRGYRQERPGWSVARWFDYAELGLLSLPFAPADGGGGGTARDTMLVMRAFGRVLALEPYLATAILGGTALRLAASPAQKAAILPQVFDGAMKLAFAHSARPSRGDPADVPATATRSGQGWVLDGTKAMVLHGDCADLLVVSARSSGDRNDTDGITLFLVDAHAAGLARDCFRLADGTRAADIAMSGVHVADRNVLGTPGSAFPAIERVTQTGFAALAAEMAGVVEAMRDMRAGGEQGADATGLQAALERADAVAELAAEAADNPDPVERARGIVHVRAGMVESLRLARSSAGDWHGDTEISDHANRLTVIEHLLGGRGQALWRQPAETA